MRTLPDMLPVPNKNLLVEGYKSRENKNRWAAFLRDKAADFDAVRLYNPTQWLGINPYPLLRNLTPDYLLVPQLTADDMFPQYKGWAEEGLKRWAAGYDLECVEMPQSKAFEAMLRRDTLRGKVVFTTATFGEQITSYGFIMAWKDFTMVQELQRTAVK